MTLQAIGTCVRLTDLSRDLAQVSGEAMFATVTVYEEAGEKDQKVTRFAIFASVEVR